MFTLAHLSDPHLAPLPQPALHELANKRLLGYLNWLRSRKAIHARPVLDDIVKDMLEQSPDHIAVGGDLINLALGQEFTNALAWLDSLGGPERVSVVPGNHDAYVPVERDTGLGLWDAYMRSQVERDGFPYLRRFGKVALIGLNTGVPTPPFFSSGRLDHDQLSALEKLLAELGANENFRIVLLHHPPLPGLARWRHALREADALRDVLARAGAELVLYGHTHIQAITLLPARTGDIPVIGAPSASSASFALDTRSARYNLFRIQRNGDRWHCEMTGRGLRARGGAVTELERLVLSG